jgi:hypothetical protein
MRLLLYFGAVLSAILPATTSPPHARKIAARCALAARQRHIQMCQLCGD